MQEIVNKLRKEFELRRYNKDHDVIEAAKQLGIDLQDKHIGEVAGEVSDILKIVISNVDYEDEYEFFGYQDD